MYYSAIGLLAVLILLIENYDILRNSKGAFEKPVWKVYRKFLFAVLLYYVTDILWGLLESRKLSQLLFVDTTVYYIVMAAGVLFWAEYTVAYLEEKSGFGLFLITFGRIVGGVITFLTFINIIKPVLFTVDGDCVYRALPLRYVMLSVQILLLVLISIYAFSTLDHHEAKKEKNHALATFGLLMALFLFAQLWFPYLPLYSIAYLLGTCLLHTVVVNDEKERFRLGLNEAEKVKELQDIIVSLLDNMPAMTFAKDAETGVYLACNQAFADYARKKTPAEAIGHTDAELFDPETAKHFVEEDQVALSMDVPYVFFETAQDAAGNQCQLQTTKLKYYNPAGKLCVLGMCQDITDHVRIHRENATTREAYEKALNTGIIYNHMAQSMARGYLLLYHVNLNSEEYVKYRNNEENGSLEEEQRGYHFFEECRLTVERIVHPDDRAEVIKSLKRKALVQALDQNKTFVITFRYLAKDEPRDVTLRVSRMEDDEDTIILGVSDVDEAMKHRREALRAKEEHVAYARLNALSGDYLCVYVVDPVTDRYREFSAAQGYESFGMSKEGTDFFATTRESLRRFIYPEDLNRCISAFNKDDILSEIETRGIFTLRYRLMMDNKPLYVQLKAAMVEEQDGSRLIVGVNNIDAQVRQEEEYAVKMAQARRNANIDSLTGIKNRHAYLEAEKRLNTQIEENHALEFAVVLLDVNDLKKVNDNDGHSAGDQLLKNACRIICDTFKHSPVFRIGGDEFAVISQGSDYARIDDLVLQMEEHNEQAMKDGGVVIACGMSRYGTDHSVETVFERADQNMYVNKGDLKARRKSV